MLEFPFEQAPSHGNVIEIRPGILWARLPLPFRLDHVNIYFIADTDGWYIVDTGIDYDESRAAWHALLEGPLKTFSFKGLIATHHHPDHIGLAGWLGRLLSIPLLTSRTAFMSCTTFVHAPAVLEAQEYSRFFASHGMVPEIAALVAGQGHAYLGMLSSPPRTFRRLAAHDTIDIGARSFEILSADGHCPEQLMLHCADEAIIFSADQVLEKITPNVSVMAFEPDGDPLGDYLASLASLAKHIPSGTLILPGHRMPFVGMQQRCHELTLHHRQKFAQITEVVQQGPKSANELVAVLYPRVVTPHELSFAFSEVLAHLNCMVKRGELFWEQTGDGALFVRHPA